MGLICTWTRHTMHLKVYMWTKYCTKSDIKSHIFHCLLYYLKFQIIYRQQSSQNCVHTMSVQHICQNTWSCTITIILQYMNKKMIQAITKLIFTTAFEESKRIPIFIHYITNILRNYSNILRMCWCIVIVVKKNLTQPHAMCESRRIRAEVKAIILLRERINRIK
jgi:hypothetical protein